MPNVKTVTTITLAEKVKHESDWIQKLMYVISTATEISGRVELPDIQVDTYHNITKT